MKSYQQISPWSIYNQAQPQYPFLSSEQNKDNPKHFLLPQLPKYLPSKQQSEKELSKIKRKIRRINYKTNHLSAKKIDNAEEIVQEKKQEIAIDQKDLVQEAEKLQIKIQQRTILTLMFHHLSHNLDMSSVSTNKAQRVIGTPLRTPRQNVHLPKIAHKPQINSCIINPCQIGIQMQPNPCQLTQQQIHRMLRQKIQTLISQKMRVLSRQKQLVSRQNHKAHNFY